MATKKYSKRGARKSFKRIRRTQRGGKKEPKPGQVPKKQHVQKPGHGPDTQKYELRKDRIPIAEVTFPFKTINAGPDAPAILRALRQQQSQRQNATPNPQQATFLKKKKHYKCFNQTRNFKSRK